MFNSFILIEYANPNKIEIIVASQYIRQLKTFGLIWQVQRNAAKTKRGISFSIVIRFLYCSVSPRGAIDPRIPNGVSFL